MMSGGGQKVLSKPSADSFAVGRRQKYTSKLLMAKLKKRNVHSVIMDLQWTQTWQIMLKQYT
jgi:hypothetical protein